MHLKPEEVYSYIIGNWDQVKMGTPPNEVTIRRAFKKIPGWNAWRDVNLGKQKRGHRDGR